jgi:ABC-2 type transport system permease protein
MNALRPVLAIAAKEIRVATVSPILYVVAGVFSVIVGWFFWLMVSSAVAQSLQMLRVQGAMPQVDITDLVLQSMFRTMHVVILLVIPLLTMRLLSEERKNRTVELLLTSPLTLAQVVAGKYIAVLLLYAGILALTLYMPVMLALWGAVNWPTALLGYLGLLCVGAIYLALGLLASSLTENQISAGIITLGLLLGLWVLGGAASIVEADAVRPVLEYLSVTQHLDNFIKGLLSSVSVVYSISLTAFSLFLAHRVLDSGRWREAG